MCSIFPFLIKCSRKPYYHLDDHTTEATGHKKIGPAVHAAHQAHDVRVAVANDSGDTVTVEGGSAAPFVGLDYTHRIPGPPSPGNAGSGDPIPFESIATTGLVQGLEDADVTIDTEPALPPPPPPPAVIRESCGSQSLGMSWF